jgi:hypothetical protein
MSIAHMSRMSDLRTKKSNGRDWRKFLTTEEASELRQLDRIIAKAEKMAELPRLKRQKIQNRATVRAGAVKHG